jgi:hypothetical protein
MSETRDPAKGALVAECIKQLLLSDLIDLVCLKATLDGKEVRIKVTNPPPAPRRKPKATRKQYET